MTISRPQSYLGAAIALAITATLWAGSAGLAAAADSGRSVQSGAEQPRLAGRAAEPDSGGAGQVNRPTALPLPNSGAAPQSAYDRGGAAQYAVFCGMLGSMALIVWLFRRDIRRARSAGKSSHDSPTDGSPTDDSVFAGSVFAGSAAADSSGGRSTAATTGSGGRQNPQRSNGAPLDESA